MPRISLLEQNWQYIAFIATAFLIIFFGAFWGHIMQWWKRPRLTLSAYHEKHGDPAVKIQNLGRGIANGVTIGIRINPTNYSTCLIDNIELFPKEDIKIRIRYVGTPNRRPVYNFWFEHHPFRNVDNLHFNNTSFNLDQKARAEFDCRGKNIKHIVSFFNIDPSQGTLIITPDKE